MGTPDLRVQNKVPASPHDFIVKVKALLSLIRRDSELGIDYAIIRAFALFIVVVLFVKARELAVFCVASILASLEGLWALEKMHLASLWSFTGVPTVVVSLWCLMGIWCLRWYTSRRKSIYLVDFSCYLPDSSMKCNYELCEYITRKSQMFTVPSMEFQRKIFLRSGLGDETYVPPFFFKDRVVSLREDARREAEMVMFGSVDELLKKTGVTPQDISILVSNCSLFSPCPSHSDMIVNRFKLREDVKTFELTGMGCSASVIACTLARDMLATRSNQYALVVSYENITLNWYFGNDKSRLVANCLFRSGCAAMLLTNKQSEMSRSKYEFSHCVRTHKAADDKAYRCAFQSEDEDGHVAVALNKNLMGVAADALRTNIITLGPLILPLSEQFLFVFSYFCRKLLKLKVQLYQPDFKLAVEHFCFHAGGRAVIDEVQKGMRLKDSSMEPCRATLHRFGNTSASSLWYVLAYMEAKRRVKQGDKVWMLGLGSGFKCNSIILRALDNITPDIWNPWAECIHRYPHLLDKRRYAV